MARPRARRTALYCTIVCKGQIAIARMPETFVSWATIRRELHASMRREHGTLAKDIHAIEALAGIPGGDDDGGRTQRLCELGFSGDAGVLTGFALHGWDARACAFRLERAAPEGALSQ